MTGMKYIRIRDIIRPEQSKMIEILDTVLLSLSSVTASTDEKHPTSHSSMISSQCHSISTSNVPITEITSIHRPFDPWTSNSDDIKAWFSHNKISKQIRDLFDFQTGEEMLDYAQLLINDRDKQMNVYAKVYRQTYGGNEMAPHEFNRFAKALEKLYKEHCSSSSITKESVSTSVKSSTCAIF